MRTYNYIDFYSYSVLNNVGIGKHKLYLLLTGNEEREVLGLGVFLLQHFHLFKYENYRITTA